MPNEETTLEHANVFLQMDMEKLEHVLITNYDIGPVMTVADVVKQAKGEADFVMGCSALLADYARHLKRIAS